MKIMFFERSLNSIISCPCHDCLQLYVLKLDSIFFLESYDYILEKFQSLRLLLILFFFQRKKVRTFNKALDKVETMELKNEIRQNRRDTKRVQAEKAELEKNKSQYTEEIYIRKSLKFQQELNQLSIDFVNKTILHNHSIAKDNNHLYPLFAMLISIIQGNEELNTYQANYYLQKMSELETQQSELEHLVEAFMNSKPEVDESDDDESDDECEPLRPPLHHGKFARKTLNRPVQTIMNEYHTLDHFEYNIGQNKKVIVLNPETICNNGFFNINSISYFYQDQDTWVLPYMILHNKKQVQSQQYLNCLNNKLTSNDITVSNSNINMYLYRNIDIFNIPNIGSSTDSSDQQERLQGSNYFNHMSCNKGSIIEIVRNDDTMSLCADDLDALSLEDMTEGILSDSEVWTSLFFFIDTKNKDFIFLHHL